MTAIAAVLVLAVVVLGTRVRPDAAAPPSVAYMVEPGRDVIQYTEGVTTAFPYRFVEARCSADRRVALVYENALGGRFYAITSTLPEPNSPDPVISIHGVAGDAYGADSFSGAALVPCSEGAAG